MIMIKKAFKSDISIIKKQSIFKNSYYMGKFYFISLFFYLHFCSVIQCFDEYLDTILHDHAFRVMIHRRPHTGALYNASLPANLSGMKVSVVGLRSKTLWKKGANFSDFIIPPRTLPIPYVKRLLIVYHNLGNWSSSYYAITGYTFLSPVVGFLVYDASHLRSRNLSKLELNTMGKPVTIQFHNSTWRDNRRRMKCAEFGASGEVFLSEMNMPNVCYSTSTQGHFSVVIPLEKNRKKKMRPIIWVTGILAGIFALVLAGLAGTVAVRLFMGKKSEEMEKEADEGESMQIYWMGNSKIPRAEVTRTQPVLESTTNVPNPKLSWYA